MWSLFTCFLEVEWFIWSILALTEGSLQCLFTQVVLDLPIPQNDMFDLYFLNVNSFYVKINQYLTDQKFGLDLSC